MQYLTVNNLRTSTTRASEKNPAPLQRTTMQDDAHTCCGRSTEHKWGGGGWNVNIKLYAHQHPWRAGVLVVCLLRFEVKLLIRKWLLLLLLLVALAVDETAAVVRWR